MRAVAILVMGGLLGLGLLGCNSEATQCPNPAVCDNGPFDAADAGDAAADSGADAAVAETATDAGADAEAEVD